MKQKITPKEEAYIYDMAGIIASASGGDRIEIVKKISSYPTISGRMALIISMLNGTISTLTRTVRRQERTIKDLKNSNETLRQYDLLDYLPHSNSNKGGQ